jgi:two-component system nitrate/nitrite response regulator NarL
MSATVEVSVRANGFHPSEHDAVTVVLADHDELTRLGLRAALESKGFSVVAEAADADEAVGAALRFQPSVCLLDMSMPGGGINAAAEIVPMLPDTRIAILGTDASGEGEVMEALHAGADGYLLKETTPERLSTALRALLRGEAVLPRALTARLVLELRCAAAANDVMPARSRLRYAPRLTHHYRRRRASGMSRLTAWRSSRIRMRDYR